jgi:hypothetical protein
VETSVESKRQPLSAKAMNPTHLNIRQGERTSLVCPDCKRWRFVNRGGLVVGHRINAPGYEANPHHTDGERRYRDEAATAPLDFGPRCRGSRRKLIVDLPLAEWELRFAEVLANTAQRRSDSAERLPRPKATPAVSQMPTPRTAKAALDDHLKNCPKCRTRTLCPAGRYMTVRVDVLEIARALRGHETTCKNCKKQRPCVARDWMRAKHRAAKEEHSRQIARLEALRPKDGVGGGRSAPGQKEAVRVGSAG